MSEPRIATWGREVQAVVIVLVMLGITLGVGLLLEGQFDSMIKNITGTGIPSMFRISFHQATLGLLMTLLVISALILLVFGVVIPTIQKGASGGGPAPA